MTQQPGPPDDATGPTGPEDPRPTDPWAPDVPADDPTVPWTPPSAADDGPVAPPLTPTAGEPYFPDSQRPSPLSPPPAPPTGTAGTSDAEGPAASPLISWSPSGTGGTPTPDPATPSPVVGWQLQAPRPLETAQGFRLAGIAPRLVAYFLDNVLISVIPTILSFALVDYAGYFRDVLDSLAIDPVTGMPLEPVAPLPTPPELFLITVISTAISFLYFVGFWTSGGQATPGMRGLGMRLVDVTGGTTLTLVQATKRWLAFGAPLALLAFVPPFQAIAGLLQIGLSLILLITAGTDDRKQGLHDRWADSIVIRSNTSGAAATALGCLLLGLIVIGFAFVVSTVLLGSIAPDLIDRFQTLEPVP